MKHPIIDYDFYRIYSANEALSNGKFRYIEIYLVHYGYFNAYPVTIDSHNDLIDKMNIL